MWLLLPGAALRLVLREGLFQGSRTEFVDSRPAPALFSLLNFSPVTSISVASFVFSFTLLY